MFCPRSRTSRCVLACRSLQRLREPYRNAAHKTPADIRAEELKLAFERDGLPVHMLDIHIEKGMHCVDCHFVQDVHGNGRLQREVRAAIEIACEDCHGTETQPATLDKFLGTSGPAAYTSGPDGRNLEAMRTPWGKRRFERENGKLFQNSMVEQNLRWEVVQVADTINPAQRPLQRPLAHGENGAVWRPTAQIEWGEADGERASVLTRASG